MTFKIPILIGILIGHSLSLFTSSYTASAVSSPSQVLISELQTNGGTGQSGSEFIELYNPSESDISLAGWSVQYHAASNSDCINGWSRTPKIALVAPAIIKAYGFYLIAATTYSGDADTRFTAGLSDSAGTIRVLRPDLTTSDALAWGVSACGSGSPSLSPTNGRSIERRPGEDNTDSGNGINSENNSQDFLLKTLPEPQTSDSVIENPLLASPTLAEISSYLPISISELLIDPVSPASDATDEFIELENPNSDPVDIGGYILKTPNSQFHLPPTIIAPGQFTLITSADSTISLSNDGGNIQLFDPNGLLVDESAPWPKAISGASWSSFAEGWMWSKAATPLSHNVLDELVDLLPPSMPAVPGSTIPTIGDPLSYLPLQITELYIDPASPLSDSQNEFIELYNPNADSVDVFGYVLKTGSSLGNSAVLAHHIINPNEYLTLYSAETSLPLSNSGSSVQLFDPAGAKIGDAVSYGPAKSGQVWMLGSDKWQWSTTPTPSLTNILTLPPQAVKKATSAKSQAAKKSSSKSVSKPKVQKPKKSPAPKAKLAKSSNQNAPIPVSQRKTSGYTLILILLGLTICYVIYEFRYDIRHTYHRLRGHTNPRA